ncbi:hypothetical protein ACJRO7_017811 [Eucalyptus globulus]|uniref:Pectinesterase inhibitor domain-containing protein n=1 Tax=Eucalyptus globulus TaxID=34317 RepID=A0ABD3KRH5_EUCGL
MVAACASLIWNSNDSILFVSHSVFALVILQSARVTAMSELVNKVHKQATNYTFCINLWMHSDPWAPNANDYTLACTVSGFLVYRKASSTRGYTTSMLNNTTGPGKDSSVPQCIQQRRNNYEKAVLKREEALGDLDTKSFFGSADLATIAGMGTDDCKSAFKRSPSSMSDNNWDLKRSLENMCCCR